jgi:gluconokinase
MTCIVLCGVAGSGKTSIGRGVALELGARFCDADDLHSSANIEKMARGEPLTDEDRLQWLTRVHEVILGGCERDEALVVACSALKKSHRHLIVHGSDGCSAEREKMEKYVTFVLLLVDRPTVEQRLAARIDHFFPVSLVGSQFDALEITDDLLVLDEHESSGCDRDAEGISQATKRLLDLAKLRR